MEAFQQSLHKNVTEQVIGAAMEVHRQLRNGLDEKLCENALCLELADRDISFDQQKRFPVSYKQRPIGTLIPDLVVEDSVIVEAKVAESFNDAHVSQILGYLKITGLQVGLLLNFKHASLKIKRVAL